MPLDKRTNALTVATRRADSKNSSSIQRGQDSPTKNINPCKETLDKLATPILQISSNRWALPTEPSSWKATVIVTYSSKTSSLCACVCP